MNIIRSEGNIEKLQNTGWKRNIPEPLEADPDRLLIVGSFDSAAYLFLLLPPLPADGEVAELCAAVTLGDVEP